ncbi:hypothetical protein [Labrys wisconsinensis]|uniref:Uncharacterized protein n=1 Tax=Labrys wisconsinensis TaxID=425677 RepID=A0ABU0JQH3_9HYPH|nr:hypothetical protein [Labrys wisconsinensis]MDQ0475397.1 hypothetical protein [Labrys wisconsinensis]
MHGGDGGAADAPIRPREEPLHRDVYELRNIDAEPVAVLAEPWVEVFVAGPGETLRFVASSGVPGAFETEHRGREIVLHGWPGSMLEVFRDDRSVYRSTAPVPPLPSGMSMRTFVDLLFGRRAAEADPRRRRTR